MLVRISAVKMQHPTDGHVRPKNGTLKVLKTMVLVLYLIVFSAMGFAIINSRFNSDVPHNQLPNLLSTSGDVVNLRKPITTSSSVIDVQKLGASSGPRFSVSNKYTERGDEPVFSDYVWIKGPIVEPYLPTKLTVLDPIKSYRYKWIWQDLTYDGPQLEILATKVGAATVTLLEVDSLGAVVRKTEQALAVKYVRREIRALFDEDREAFFEAMKTMLTTPTAVGKEIYGLKYQDISYFVKLHAIGAGGACDQMHLGAGFLNNHAGITLEFEQGLQVINPAVTVPYWEYTIDSHEVLTRHDGDGSYLWKSILFDPDWFGTYSEETHTLDQGRWAGLLKIQEDQWDSPVHNSYGLLRAPWNNNKNPLTTRFKELADIPMDNFFAGEWPSCEAYDAFFDTRHSMPEFMQKIGGLTHTGVHPVLGGTHQNAGKPKKYSDYDVIGYNKLYQLGWNPDDVYTLKRHASRTAKELWRLGFMTCPEKCSPETPMEECTCSCGTKAELVDLLLDNTDYFDKAWAVATGGMAAFDAYTYGQRVDFFDMACQLSLSIGDQLEASSPADLIFWVLHPPTERLAQGQLLAKGLEDERWGADDNVYWGNVPYGDDPTCFGHQANDVLPWKMDLDDDEEDKVQLSNIEFYNVFNPAKESYKLPYVYDNFDWPHCEAEGYIWTRER